MVFYVRNFFALLWKLVKIHFHWQYLILYLHISPSIWTYYVNGPDFWWNFTKAWGKACWIFDPMVSIIQLVPFEGFKQCCRSESGIRDPVPFSSLDPGSGMGKKSRCGSGMNFPDHITENLETIFGSKIPSLWRGSGSGIQIFLTRDAGWNTGFNPGFGLRVPHYRYSTSCPAFFSLNTYFIFKMV